MTRQPRRLSGRIDAALAPARHAIGRALADRTLRERLLLLGLVAVAGLAGLHVLLWSPAMTRHAGLMQRLLALDRVTLQLAATPPAPRAPYSNRAPALIVTETAAAAGLILRRLEPDGDRLRLTLDDAAFEDVLTWIETLDRDHGLTPFVLEITRRPAPGLVAATLTLER